MELSNSSVVEYKNYVKSQQSEKATYSVLFYTLPFRLLEPEVLTFRFLAQGKIRVRR